MTDDDAVGEFVTGEFDVGIRRMPYTNFRWSYGSINQRVLNRRDQLAPDVDGGTGTPFAVHRTGEVWSATLWDMRELLIMKDPNGKPETEISREIRRRQIKASRFRQI